MWLPVEIVRVVSGDSGRWGNISFIGEASVSGLPSTGSGCCGPVGTSGCASECLQRVVEIISFIG